MCPRFFWQTDGSPPRSRGSKVLDGGVSGASGTCAPFGRGSLGPAPSPVPLPLSFPRPDPRPLGCITGRPIPCTITPPLPRLHKIVPPNPVCDGSGPPSSLLLVCGVTAGVPCSSGRPAPDWGRVLRAPCFQLIDTHAMSTWPMLCLFPGGHFDAGLLRAGVSPWLTRRPRADPSRPRCRRLADRARVDEFC